MKRDSLVSYGLDCAGIFISITCTERDYSFLHIVQIQCAAYAFSFLVGAGGYFAGDTTVGL